MEEMNLFGMDSKKADLEMVKRNGMALRFVKDQTPEICLAAVKDYGLVLEYVKNQTTDICLAAIKQNPEAKRFVRIALD